MLFGLFLSWLLRVFLSWGCWEAAALHVDLLQAHNLHSYNFPAQLGLSCSFAVRGVLLGPASTGCLALVMPQVRWIGAPLAFRQACCATQVSLPCAHTFLLLSPCSCFLQVRWIGAPLAYCVALSVAVGVYHNLADVSCCFIWIAAAAPLLLITHGMLWSL